MVILDKSGFSSSTGFFFGSSLAGLEDSSSVLLFIFSLWACSYSARVIMAGGFGLGGSSLDSISPGANSISKSSPAASRRPARSSVGGAAAGLPPPRNS